MSVLRWAIRRSWPGLAASSVAGLGYQGGLILLPWCLGQALDRGIAVGDRAAVWFWAGAVVAVSLGLVLAEVGLRWWSSLAANRTGNALAERVVATVMGLDRETAGRFSHGDLVTRGTRDVAALTEFLQAVPSLISGTVGFVTVLAVIAGLDPLLALIGLATLPLLALINIWYPRRFERANDELSQAHARRAAAVEDLLSASAAVRGIGGEDVLVHRHHATSAAVTERTLALARIAANWSAVAPFVPWLATGVGLAVGGLAVLDGRFTVGGLVAFAAWMALLARQVMMLTARFHQLGAARTASARIGDVLRAEPLLPEPPVARALPARGTLVAKGLTLGLPDRAPLTWPDLEIAPGEFVVVSGPVGSGKSTLLRLLARLQDPAEGTVTFGGVDLRDAATAEVRDRIGLVPQRPGLVSGTVADTLRLGRDDLDDLMLWEACRIAAVDDHLAELPARLATEVGERGTTLSGGQVQRLALARALVRRPGVLLIDDVTSAVDTDTELSIVERLRAWAPDTAIVAATSRSAVAERADRVVVLGGGERG